MRSSPPPARRRLTRLGKRLGTGWGSFRVAADRNLSTGSSCHDDFNYGTPRLALPAPGLATPAMLRVVPTLSIQTINILMKRNS